MEGSSWGDFVKTLLKFIDCSAKEACNSTTGDQKEIHGFSFLFFFFFFFFKKKKKTPHKAAVEAASTMLVSFDPVYVPSSWAAVFEPFLNNIKCSERDLEVSVFKRETADKKTLQALYQEQSLLHSQLQSLKTQLIVEKTKKSEISKRSEIALKKIEKDMAYEPEELNCYPETFLSCVTNYCDSARNHQLLSRLKRPRGDHDAMDWMSVRLGDTLEKNEHRWWKRTKEDLLRMQEETRELKKE